ncbi:MAG: IS1096 element passenger TnpR family protein [Anaerolineae bacterium]
MFGYQPSRFEFTTEHADTLQKTEFGREESPDTILHDFDALLRYVLERKLRVTGTHQLPLRALSEINRRLAQPVLHGLQRPVQKSFPPIHGLYLVLRASGLTYVDATGSKPYLLIDDEVYRVWQSLNPTERYGNLLESWLLRGSPDIIGERIGYHDPVPDNSYKSAWFFAVIPDDGLQVAGASNAKVSLKYTPEWHNLGLLSLFGWIRIEQGPPQPGEGWRIERIFRTRLGDALLALLGKEFFGNFDKIRELPAHDEIPFGILQPILKPYFPDWHNNLIVPEPVHREGVHIFKVSLDSIWRRIAIPADASLHSLASAIINSIDFMHDHLYYFAFESRTGVRKYINHPYMDEGPWASEMEIGDVPICVGQTMEFLYDFGDQWEFDVVLERVDPEMDVQEAVVIDSYGESPEQYPTWGGR